MVIYMLIEIQRVADELRIIRKLKPFFRSHLLLEAEIGRIATFDD